MKKKKDTPPTTKELVELIILLQKLIEGHFFDHSVTVAADEVISVLQDAIIHDMEQE